MVRTSIILMVLIPLIFGCISHKTKEWNDVVIFGKVQSIEKNDNTYLITILDRIYPSKDSRWNMVLDGNRVVMQWAYVPNLDDWTWTVKYIE